MARGRRVAGAGRIKALLRGMPEAMRREMADAFDAGGKDMESAMKSRAPRRTGALHAGISYKVQPRSLTLKVGLLGTKRGRSEIFYGRIQDLGRRAQTVLVKRRNTRPYLLRVRAMAGKRFVTGRFPELRRALREKVRGIFGRALGSISGAGSD